MVDRLEAEKDSIAGVIITSAKKTFFAGGDLNDLIKATKDDAEQIARILADEQPDAIMHLAAETHVDRSIDEPQPFIDTNILLYLLDDSAVAPASVAPADAPFIVPDYRG